MLTFTKEEIVSLEYLKSGLEVRLGELPTEWSPIKSMLKDEISALEKVLREFRGKGI